MIPTPVSMTERLVMPVADHREAAVRVSRRRDEWDLEPERYRRRRLDDRPAGCDPSNRPTIS
jgi:hypothetical protein